MFVTVLVVLITKIWELVFIGRYFSLWFVVIIYALYIHVVIVTIEKEKVNDLKIVGHFCTVQMWSHCFCLFHIGVRCYTGVWPV